MMPQRHDKTPAWVIWGLVVLFGLIEAGAWLAMGGVPRRPGVLVPVVSAWVVMIILALLATRRTGTTAHRVLAQQHTHDESLGELEQLELQNAMLEIIARSVDVTLAFQALASRIARLVPCDRVGLALLTDNGQEFQTYTARVNEEERRARPRPEVVFKIDQTLLGSVVRSREALIVSDIAQAAPDFLDANRLHSSGFGSVMIVPLLSKGRVVGALDLARRGKGAYRPEHAAAIQPIAEIFAVAVIAQQLQVSLGKYRSMEAMSELTLSIASEINGACRRSSDTAICWSAAIRIRTCSATSPPSSTRRSASPRCSKRCAPPRTNG
jgi:transcriptional regulator with GAF, ATPase, and Fis domain